MNKRWGDRKKESVRNIWREKGIWSRKRRTKKSENCEKRNKKQKRWREGWSKDRKSLREPYSVNCLDFYLNIKHVLEQRMCMIELKVKPPMR